MRRPVRTRSVRPPKAERQAAPGSWRDRLAVLLALVTVVLPGLGLLSRQGHAVPDAGAAGERSRRDRELQRLPHQERQRQIELGSRPRRRRSARRQQGLSHLPQNAGHGLQRARRFGRCAGAKHQAADQTRREDARAAIGSRAEHRLPDRRHGRTRSLLRDLPPGASGRQFQSEQDLQRAMPLLPRGEVRQLRRPSPAIRELSVQEAYTDHLRPCRPFRQALPGSGEAGSGKAHSRYLLDLPQQPRRQASHGRGAVRADLRRLPSRPDHRQGAGQRPERHRLPDPARPRPANAEEEEGLDRRMAGSLRSRAHTVHEGDDQPE